MVVHPGVDETVPDDGVLDIRELSLARYIPN